MDYIVENAGGIMRLCFGLGFLILALTLSHTVWNVNKVVKKLERAADILLKLFSTPVALSLQIKDILEHVSKYLPKKKD